MTTSVASPRSKRNKQPIVIDPDDELRLLGLRETAELLGVAQVTVQRYVKRKQLRCIRLGRSTRFARHDIGVFIRKHATTGSPAEKKR